MFFSPIKEALFVSWNYLSKCLTVEAGSRYFGTNPCPIYGVFTTRLMCGLVDCAFLIIKFDYARLLLQLIPMFLIRLETDIDIAF